MTPEGSFAPRMERPQEGQSVLEWNDPREVIGFPDRTTPGGLLVLGWNDPRGFIQS